MISKSEDALFSESEIKGSFDDIAHTFLNQIMG